MNFMGLMRRVAIAVPQFLPPAIWLWKDCFAKSALLHKTFRR